MISMSWLEDGYEYSPDVPTSLADPDMEDPPVVADGRREARVIGRIWSPAAHHAANVLEQPGRVLERLLVLPKLQELASQGQDRPEVDGRADVLLHPRSNMSVGSKTIRPMGNKPASTSMPAVKRYPIRGES